MKAPTSISNFTCLKWALFVSFVSLSSVIFSQTSTWNGTSWSDVTPGPGTGSYTFYVDAGTNCTIGDANMTALYVRNAGTVCTITGTVSSTSVIIQYFSSYPTLSVNGTLNVSNLTLGGFLNGTGTVNLSAGTFAQTYDGIHPGGIYPSLVNFNLLSGSISFTYLFVIQNLTILSGASATISNYVDPTYPRINGTLTVNGNLTNNYAQLGAFSSPIYFMINNLVVNSTGSYNSSLGYSNITHSIIIGGSLIPAGSSNSYYYNWDVSGNTNELDVFGNTNLKFSDLTHSDPSYKYLGTLKVSNGGKFKIDRNLTVNTITINTGGIVTASNSPTVTASTITDPIDGRLVLPTATLNYNATALTLSGTNSAIGFINKPAMQVTVNGSTDSVYNCNLQRVTVSNGAKGYISNSAAGYKIQRIDIADQVTIASLPKTDSIIVSGTGNVTLTGDTRVNQLVDIANGGSLTSNGNLTMRDESNLYFVNDGQIVGNIKWHRKYGSTGWIFIGSPFPNVNSGLISTTGGISQQTITTKKYVESKVSPRWVVVPTTETWGHGSGYIVGLSTISNDTLIFTGQPHLQTVTVTGLTYSSSNGAIYNYQKGYNMVANPFTAPISVDGFFTDNSTLNAIYYWDNVKQNTGVYVTRTKGGLFTPLVSTLTAKNQNKINTSYLAPNQGFFIKIDSTNSSVTSVTFNPSSITRDLNSNFLKSAPTVLRLFTKNSSGSQNDIIFQFSNTVSENVNPGLDFSKLLSDNFPVEIYSIKKGNKLAIQTLKSDTAGRIPIGIVAAKNEKYSFWINDFSALSELSNVFLYDKVVNRSVNMKDSALTVSLAPGTYDDRFELVFKKFNLNTGVDQSLVSGQENIENGRNIVVRAQYGQMYIDFPEQYKNVHIQVSDITGRVIYEKSISLANGTFLVDSNFLVNSVYLFRISGDNLFKTSKLLLR